MDWKKLFSMQKKLDAYIESNQRVEGKDLFEEKYLALLVELGELANETRCFKFWSTKPGSERDVILAEYVDGIHFILSLGIDKEYQYESTTLSVSTNTVTQQFNLVYDKCVMFKREQSKKNYEEMFDHYLQLGNLLGFDEKSLQAAYIKKNEINYERQDHGY